MQGEVSFIGRMRGFASEKKIEIERVLERGGFARVNQTTFLINDGEK